MSAVAVTAGQAAQKSNRALDALDDFSDTDLVIAHSQWQAEQMQARVAVAPKNRAARRAAAKKRKA